MTCTETGTPGERGADGERGFTGSPGIEGTPGRTDINECLTENGGCADICINLFDSFMCQCRHGYKLQEDGRSCDGKNEKNENSFVKCYMKIQFMLLIKNLVSHFFISDINECTEYGPCHQVCVNTVGSFRCECFEGFVASESSTGAFCIGTVYK